MAGPLIQAGGVITGPGRGPERRYVVAGSHQDAGRVTPEGCRVTVSRHLRKEERMGPWRGRSVWWTLGLGLVVVTLGLGGPPQAAAQTPCTDYSGVCYGQCRAALAQGCFEHPDTRQCGKREEQWTFFACPGTPPWAPQAAVCPCAGRESQGLQWSESFTATSCLWEGLYATDLRVTGTAGSLTTTSASGDLGCGIGTEFSQGGLSAEAFAACNDSLQQIAANDGVMCLVAP